MYCLLGPMNPLDLLHDTRLPNATIDIPQERDATPDSNRSS
jgi:hypothetical protein